MKAIERREFVKTLAAAGVAIAVPHARRTTHDARRLDKIGIQLYTVRDQMKADFEGTLAHVAEIGYKEVEFAGYFDHTPADVRAILDRHGLSAPSTHIALGEIDAWKASLDTAKAIGHEYIVVPWIPQEKRLTLDGWKNVAGVCACRSAATSGSVHGPGPSSNVSATRRLLSPPQNTGVPFQTSCCSCVGASPGGRTAAAPVAASTSARTRPPRSVIGFGTTRPNLRVRRPPRATAPRRGSPPRSRPTHRL